MPRDFSSASAAHQHLQNWHSAGCLQKLWQAGLAKSDGMPGMAWQGRSADGAMGKAPLVTECAGPNPENRETKRTQMQRAGERPWGPLSIAVGGANLRDSKLLNPTLVVVVIPRSEVTGWKDQLHLRLDAGYVGDPPSKVARKQNYDLRSKSGFSFDERISTIS